MTITSTPYVDDPIVLVTVEGMLDETDVNHMHQEVLEACDRLGVCFIVLDLLGAEATIQECLTLLLTEEILARHRNGKLHIAVVRESKPEESLENIPYPVLSDQDAAVEHVRHHIATQSSDGSTSQPDV